MPKGELVIMGVLPKDKFLSLSKSKNLFFIFSVKYGEYTEAPNSLSHNIVALYDGKAGGVLSILI